MNSYLLTLFLAHAKYSVNVCCSEINGVFAFSLGLWETMPSSKIRLWWLAQLRVDRMDRGLLLTVHVNHELNISFEKFCLVLNISEHSANTEAIRQVFLSLKRIVLLVTVECWHEHGPVKDPTPQSRGSGKAFLRSGSEEWVRGLFTPALLQSGFHDQTMQDLMIAIPL